MITRQNIIIAHICTYIQYHRHFYQSFYFGGVGVGLRWVLHRHALDCIGIVGQVAYAAVIRRVYIGYNYINECLFILFESMR